MLATGTMTRREDSVLASPINGPALLSAPKTPKISRRAHSSPISPSTPTPSREKHQRTAQSPIVKEQLPYGARTPDKLSAVSNEERNRLHGRALKTQSDSDKFYRIIAWGGNVKSSVSLRTLDTIESVRYLEDTFPGTYPKDGQRRRTGQLFSGPEPQHGASIDRFQFVYSSPLFVPMENFFDFKKYYGGEKQPAEKTLADQIAWEEQSQCMQSMARPDCWECQDRVLRGRTTAWLNQR